MISRQSETFAALKAWYHWLSQLHTTSIKSPEFEPRCRELTSSIMIAVAPVIKSAAAVSSAAPMPEPLVHSAAHFMATLTGTVRPPSIWKLKEFTELYSSVTSLRLASDDRRLVIRALANVLLLNWPGLSDQRWDERQKHLSKFLRDFGSDFNQIRHMEGFASNPNLQQKGRSGAVMFRMFKDGKGLSLFQHTL